VTVNDHEGHIVHEISISRRADLAVVGARGHRLGRSHLRLRPAGRRVTVGGSFARTNIPPALTAATYDLGNRLLTWDGTSYTYDLNGNLTGDGTTTYTWNARNQLTAIAGGAAGGFAYDALSRRTSRTVGGVTTNYLYDGVDVVQEQIGGSPSANYLPGLGIDERFTRTDGTGTVGYLADALGSTIAQPASDARRVHWS
jgi:YD repeat-containing protein